MRKPLTRLAFVVVNAFVLFLFFQTVTGVIDCITHHRLDGDDAFSISGSRRVAR